METTPFDTNGLTAVEVQLFNEVFDELKTTFNATVGNDCEISFAGFRLFAGYTDFNTHCAIDIGSTKGISYITFTQVRYSRAGRFGTGTEYQTWGMVKLQKDFGHIIIKPETFMDKIRDFIFPVEINFEDDADFSDRFYVVTDDKDKTQELLNADWRKAISDIDSDEFFIEIKNNRLIIGDEKIINTDSSVAFGEFLNVISGLK